MKTQNIMVLLVATLALFFYSLSSVSAAPFGYISSVEVDGVEGLAGTPIAVFDGQNLEVRLVFYADANADDVRIKAWLSGGKDFSVSSERFDVLAGNIYSRTMNVQMPYNIDPSEAFNLEMSVESANDGIADQQTISLTGQRESYVLQVLDAIMSSNAKAGDRMSVDIVLKNRGRQPADDTFVTVSIPALGVEAKAYFGDLTPVDQANPDKTDSVERRMYLTVPSTASAGVYTMNIEAYNADSDARVSKKIAIAGASDDTALVSSVTTKSFATGDTGEYSLTLVNSGNSIRVYDLVFETPAGLTVTTDDTTVVVPAGSSRTVKLEASATKAGTYNFAVDANSDGALFKRQSYIANVESKGFAGSAAVLLTVVLAIIFVVLLVVLIVLLTRKPEKSEEFEESYY